MRVTTDSELRQWRETVQSFMRDEIGIDYCRKCYRERTYPHELYDALVDEGWIGLTVPEEYGGRGGDQVEQAVLLEALGRFGYDFGVPALTSATGVQNVLEFGTQTQIDRFVPAILDGDVRFTVGVTEPETGSDAASLQTRAERSGEGTYVVTGEKTYQSGAAAPDTLVHAYIRTDPDAPKREGISLLVIPTDLDAVDVTELSLVSRKAAGTAQLSFDGARVPVDNRLGDEGEGWSLLTDHLILEHTGMAALMVGNAQSAVDAAADEAATRERFGRPIGEHQAIGHRLADMQTEVDSARMLVYRAASAIDRDGGSRHLTAQAKLKAGEVLQSVAADGMQILGGEGLVSGSDMERYWREGASATIAGGTSEIQRSIVSRELLSRRDSEE